MPLWVSPSGGGDVDPVEVVTDPAALAALSAFFATIAQGEKADTAVQPGDDAADLGSGTAPDGYVLTADGAGGAAWEPASGGGSGGGAVDSVNGKTGVVVLDYTDVGAASAAQGAKADTAVQPESLAAVATSGDYSDLSGTPTLAAVATSGDYSDLTGTPTLGTAAAADTGDFATAAQGAKADTAVQPEALAAVATSGAYSDLTGTPTLGTAAGMSPVDVVTDSTAQASLSGTFVQYVRWTGSAWPARPASAPVVMFISTHDSGAPAPDDLNLAAGDIWLQAPA